jgi:MFS family permease
VVNAYTIAYAGFILVGGSLADAVGRRRAVLAGLAVHGAGSVGSALAPSLASLLAARAVQGLGSAIMLPASLALLVVAFPKQPRRDRAFGAWGASGGAALVCGGLLGGVLSAHLGWRAVFAANALLVAGIAALVIRAPDDHRGAVGKPQIDLAGAALAAATLAMLVFAAAQLQASGPATPQTLAPLLGMVLTCVAFVAAERRSAAPLIRFGLLRIRAVAGANVLNLLFPAGFLGVLFLGSLLLQSVYRFSGSAAGLAILPFSGMVVAGTMLVPWLIGRAGLVPVGVTGFCLLAIGLIGMAAATATSYLAVALPAFAVLGAGAALASVPIAIAAVAGVPEADRAWRPGCSPLLSRLGAP